MLQNDELSGTDNHERDISGGKKELKKRMNEEMKEGKKTNEGKNKKNRTNEKERARKGKNEQKLTEENCKKKKN